MPSMAPAELLELAEGALSLNWSLGGQRALLGREQELQQILALGRGCIDSARSASVHVCGCPGTGKTMAVKKAAALLQERQEQMKGPELSVVFLNCMSLPDPSAILEQISEHLHGLEHPSAPSKRRNVSGKSVEEAQSNERESTLLLILDEVDTLVRTSKDLSILQQIFRMPFQTNRTCLLIGISNTLHLVEKFLPRLRDSNCAPETVTFSAYSETQILDVLLHRLQTAPTASLVDVFDRKCLQLCAKKVAATSGDMRRALDASRLALNLAHAELMTPPDDGSQEPIIPEERSPGPKCQSPGLRAEVHHMAQALASTLSAPASETVRSLPLHQQMILSALVLDARRHVKDPSEHELYFSYCRLHKKHSLASLPFSEFSVLCQTLAGMGLVRISGASGRNKRKRKVAMEANQEDITFALQGVRLFKTILDVA